MGAAALLKPYPASETSRVNMTVRSSRDGGGGHLARARADLAWRQRVRVLVALGGSAGIVFETMQGSY
jgi:hypothetical protein